MTSIFLKKETTFKTHVEKNTYTCVCTVVVKILKASAETAENRSKRFEEDLKIHIDSTYVALKVEFDI